MFASVHADRPLHHVAVAVASLEEASSLFSLLLGAAPTPVETLPEQGVRLCFVGSLELLEPLGPDTPVGRFLTRRGQALHHIAYVTEDIVAELARLESEGLELIDRVPRRGAGGHLVAFVHPTSTSGVLVELVQHT